MRASVAVGALFVAGAAHADPTHISALAKGGFWVTGHAYGEKEGGAEATVERDLGDIYRLGVGASVDEYKINDDECFGSTGQFAKAFASIGLREPEAKTIHLFVVARLGFTGARMVSSCNSASVRYDGFTFEALVAGVDVGDGKTRVRVQMSASLTTIPNAPVELSFGVGASF